MSNARETILGAVRASLGRGPLDDAKRAELDARVPSHTRPAQDENPVERFVRKFESRSGTVARVASRDEIPAAVEAYRVSHDLKKQAAVGGSLRDLKWPRGWKKHHDAAGIDEALSVTTCLVGIAETGSLIFASGPDNPITHNFAPDDHIVVLEASQIVERFEDGWTLLRKRKGGMPRATNVVSGPSRTADVEQTIQLGAHGPRRVHIILVG
jgi:L-lactate dehydrogenase complex protein LldG